MIPHPVKLHNALNQLLFNCLLVIVHNHVPFPVSGFEKNQAVSLRGKQLDGAPQRLL